MANRSLTPVTVSLALLSITFSAGCNSPGDLPRDSQTVGGITNYLGVVPAALVRDHPIRAGEGGTLHGGAPEGSNSHHVVVALFHAGTGAGISDARVLAGVGDSSYDHTTDRELEPMPVNGAMSYGGFFQMPGSEIYRIHSEILRPGATHPIEGQFAYGTPRASEVDT